MDIRECVKNQNDVGFRIMKRLPEMKSNLVFSPLSIYMMTSLLAAGASKGKLRQDLLSFLNFESIPKLNSFLPKLLASVFGDSTTAAGRPFRNSPAAAARPCVTTASGIWIADDLIVKPSFQNLLQTLYKVKLKQVDFKNKSDVVVDEANSWVNKETQGLIRKIFNNYSIDHTSRLVFANTVYFKAQWASEFGVESTKNADFHRLNGSSVRVPFMISDEDQAISVFEDFKVASLAYHSDFSMLIFLPNDRDGLPSLMERACAESGFLDRHWPLRSVPVDEFKIPKFKFGFGFEMKQILKDLGLGSLFSYGLGFTEMVEGPTGRELFVSDMLHEAVICVDEKGTEAAAVTADGMRERCWRKIEAAKMNFIADHPFMFVITENLSGSILFIGRVLDPSLPN